ECRVERRCTGAARAGRGGCLGGARALVPQRGARLTRGRARSPGARARRRADDDRGARPAHALGLLLGARDALVLVAPAARTVLGARGRGMARALPPARGEPLAGVLATLRRAPAGSRLAPMAARARRRACRLSPGG